MVILLLFIWQIILWCFLLVFWCGFGILLLGLLCLGVSFFVLLGFMLIFFSWVKFVMVFFFGLLRLFLRLVFVVFVFYSLSLNVYCFNDELFFQEVFGDYQFDNVDWLVSDDVVSVILLIGNVSGLNVVVFEFVFMCQEIDMSLYDMLCMILGFIKIDDEISVVFVMYGYDFGVIVQVIMEI